MKKVFLLLLTMVLFSAINAQNKSELSDKVLSAQYKHEIEVLNSEIKTLKVKLKGDKGNVALKGEISRKDTDLKEIKSKKKVIDNAIKTKKAAEKAANKAEKAANKAEKGATDAQKLRESEAK